MTAKWIQCTSVSNDCLGGCASMAEHDCYRHRQLLAEIDNIQPYVALHEDMTRLKREAEAEIIRLKAENDALRTALHDAVLQVIREAMPRKEGEE